MDVTRRPSDTWIIDFGADTPQAIAEYYEKPFQYVLETIKPKRERNRDEARKSKWWLLGRSAEDLRKALGPLTRYILTPRVAKHRLFVWKEKSVLPDSAVVAVTRDDDTTFGVLHSRFHESWALRLGTSLEDRPRYTPSTTFETFPFPDELTPNLLASQYAGVPEAVAIADAARNLNALRERWLNPPELVRRVPEVVAGLPDRLLAINEKAAEQLNARTLTALYNERPAWLANAHRTLDEAVAAAYGWTNDISDEDAVRRLFDLNLERASAGR